MSDRAYKKMADEPEGQPAHRRSYPTSGLGQSRRVESSYPARGAARGTAAQDTTDARGGERTSERSSSRATERTSADRAAASHATSRGTARQAASEKRAGVPQHASSRSEGAERYVAQRKEKSHSKVARRVGIVFGLIIALVVGAVAWFTLDVNGRLAQGLDQNLRNVLADINPDEPFYMLLLGVDKDNIRTDAWGDDQSNFRADTIILARVDSPNKTVTLVSIPRDTLVDMGEYGEQKINTAYSFGGPAYMVECVSKLTGVQIAHYAELDFEQFVSIVDTIGGIEVTLPIPVYDMQYACIDLPAGTQTLNGGEALGLCRTRHAYDAYGGGDFYRSANQRMVIAAIVKKVLASDPATLTATVSTVAESVTTDLSVSDIVSLAAQFRNLDTDKGVFAGQLPTVSEYINGGWYEIVDQEALDAMMLRVNQGLPPYADDSQDFTAGVAGSVGIYGNSGEVDLDSLTPDFTGSVLVLNGTNVSGLARDTSLVLGDAGFSCTAENADNAGYQTSVIVYNGGSTAAAHALGVRDSLGLDVEVTRNDGTYSNEADVVVVLGTDYANTRV